MIKIKRAYEKAAAGDGKRIFVDRLWPRGLSKEAFTYDEWLKELAPSDALRKWFGHEPEKFQEFKQKYVEELAAPEKKAVLHHIAALAKEGTVTLVYGAKDVEHNNAVVMAELIGKMAREKVSSS